MSPQKRQILTDLVGNMRSAAARVGSMHAWWEDICDAENFLAKDNEKASDEEADKWIAEFRRGRS